MKYSSVNSVNSEEIPQKPPLEEPPLPDSYEPTPNKTPEPEPFPRKETNNLK